MFPFEFTVPGPPVSHQSRDRSRLQQWRQIVREAAARQWQSADSSSEPLRIVVAYYHERPAVRMDNDNLLKPIQDALIGLIYDDDRQITDTVVRKAAIDGRFRVRGASRILLEAFSRGDEFLYVKIDRAPNHADLLD